MKTTPQSNEEFFEVRDLRRKEKFVIDDEFLNGYGRIFNPDGIAVYVSLCRLVDKNQKCFPSQKRISEEINLVCQWSTTSFKF